jgi:hypothetical protein
VFHLLFFGTIFSSVSPLIFRNYSFKCFTSYFSELFFQVFHLLFFGTIFSSVSPLIFRNYFFKCFTSYFSELFLCCSSIWIWIRIRTFFRIWNRIRPKPWDSFGFGSTTLPPRDLIHELNPFPIWLRLRLANRDIAWNVRLPRSQCNRGSRFSGV